METDQSKRASSETDGSRPAVVVDVEKSAADLVEQKITVSDPMSPELENQVKEIDPNIVDWDGPDDPENPLNWPKAWRTGHVVIVSILTLFA